MSRIPMHIVGCGLATSVGLSAEATCAAIRAAITNHTETRFRFGAEWLLGAQVQLDHPWRGRAKLAQMLAMAIGECLESSADLAPETVPLLLCVAEPERPGRLDGLDTLLLREVEQVTGIQFHSELSGTIPKGRVGVAVAFHRAQQLMRERDCSHVLVGATDSLLVGPTLMGFEAAGRLLTTRNADGFVPGEAAGALLLSRTSNGGSSLECLGLGFGREPSTVDSETPFRAEGLTRAIAASLANAGSTMKEMDFRIADSSGEQYYFKEAALTVSRLLRQRKEEFDIWHPADCIGETGAAIGISMFAVALAACRKRYAPGHNVLCHLGNDVGERAAVVLRAATSG